MIKSVLNTNLTAVPKIAAVSTRNIVFSTIALFNLVIVFILVVVTNNMKRPIKITVLNLLACDIFLMLTVLIYGVFVQTELDSSHSFCAVVVFFMINGFFLSHTAVAGISLTNFMAIFYPFKHNILVTTKSVTIAVIIAWLSLCLLSGSCIIIHFPPNQPCVVLYNIPRYAVFIVFFVLFLADLSAMIMNTSLLVAIRKRKQVHVNAVFSVSRDRWAQKLLQTIPLHAQFPGDGEPEVAAMENEILKDDPDGKDRCETQPDEACFVSPRLRQHKNLSKNKCSLKVTYYRNNFNANVQPQPSTSDSFPPEQTASTDSVSDENDLHKSKNSNKSLMLNVSRLGTDENKGEKFSFVKSQTNLSLISTAQGRVHTRNQCKRLNVSMIIISVWCCIWNVPCSLYLFYVAFFAENRLHANYSTLGIIFTTILTINIFGDPFIYAWRFVCWRNIIKKLRKFCCERQYL